MGTATRKAQRKADRRKALDTAADQMAARKEKTRGAVAMSRAGDNPGDFHRPANLSAKPLSLGRNRSHLVVSF
jgi:hypothetical protein